MTIRETIIAGARNLIGLPYVWGGTSPTDGFDCSGLAQWVYNRAGIALPRTAQTQWDVTNRVETADLRVGDLVFFKNTYKIDPKEPITHVGIYAGNGTMINAASETTGVTVMDVFTGYWGEHYAGGGRPSALSDATDNPPPVAQPAIPTTGVPLIDDTLRYISSSGQDIVVRGVLVVVGAALVVVGAYVVVR